jgi:purine-nucleoside phosphorylase
MARLETAVQRVRRRSRLEPRATLVLGAGMEPLASGLSVEASFAYEELLDLSEAHPSGRLQLGRIGDLPVAAMEGVLPRYEGHALAEATLPVRVMRMLARAGPPPPLLITGVCTSLQPRSQPGDLVLLDDHINWMGENPLAGANLDALGPRFPDMSEPYDRTLQGVAIEAALDRRIPLGRGVYVAVMGPQPPTRAEYRMFRWLGADFAGNGIVPEVIAARHMGMPVLALLAVDAVRLPDTMEPLGVSGDGDTLDDARTAVLGTLQAVLERLPVALDTPRG